MMQNNYIKLYKNHKGGVGYWHIWSEENMLIWESATGLHHQPIRHTETVKEGKQGRTVLQQVEFRIRSKINSKLDAGYVINITDAKGAPTDAEGKIKPVLAQKIEDYKGKIDEHNSWVQLKYNGHRCLITKQNGKVFAYSRNGKVIPGIPHIVEQIQIDEGQVLDGELYRHGWSLQRIASAGKKLQPDSKYLKYQCYDIVRDDVYSNRLALLNDMSNNGVFGSHTILAATKRRDEINDLNSVFFKAKEAGYEGLILRLGDYPYECGRRSKGLLKIKKIAGIGYHDAEYIVIDIIRSNKDRPVLMCQLPDGGTFKVTPPGTVPEKEKAYQNKADYIGKKIKVEFPEYTEDNIPFQPVALEWFTEL